MSKLALDGKTQNTCYLFAIVLLLLTAVAANAKNISREKSETVLSKGEIISSDYNNGDASYVVRRNGKVYFCRIANAPSSIIVMCKGTGK